jgi:DNA-binding MarR family transcriptional regulator
MVGVDTSTTGTGVVAADAAVPCTGQSLDVDLGWALGTVKRAYLNAADDVVARVPGGPRGYLVLATAGRGQPSSQLALAQHLGVDRTVMTYLLDDLEQAGLVERRPDPADRRARRVLMTEAGRALLAELREELGHAEERLLEPLDEQDRVTFRSLLQRLARAVGPADPCQMLQTIMQAGAGTPARRRRR